MKALKKTSFLCLSVLFLACNSDSSMYQKGPEWEYKGTCALVAKADELGKALQAKVITEGLGTVADAPRASWGLVLTSKEKFTLDVVKPLTERFITSLVDFMYESPAIVGYYTGRENDFNESKKKYGWEESRIYQGSTLGLNDLAFRIDFWDENVDRELYPYVAEVRLAEGILYYYYANKQTGALEEAQREPFQYTPKKVIK